MSRRLDSSVRVTKLGLMETTKKELREALRRVLETKDAIHVARSDVAIRKAVKEHREAREAAEARAAEGERLLREYGEALVRLRESAKAFENGAEWTDYGSTSAAFNDADRAIRERALALAKEGGRG